MAIDFFTDDMNIIQKLDDQPNDVGGLSADELKEKFDEAGNKVKNFLNSTLIPELNNVITKEKIDQILEA